MLMNFKTFVYPVNCVWLYNGRKFPNGRFYYIMGNDSNVVKFELNDPEGVKALGYMPKD